MADNLVRISLAIFGLNWWASRLLVAAILTGISLSLQPTALHADGGLRLNLPLRPDMVGRVIGPEKPPVGAEFESFMLASFSDGSVTQLSLDGTGDPRRFFSPLREETWSKKRAIAMSADGKIFALGAPPARYAPDTARIYLFDIATGDIRSTIDFLPTRPLSLAFSAYPEGLYLGATFADGFGPRLWRLTVRQEIIESEEIALDQSGFRKGCPNPEDDYRDCNTPALAFNPHAGSDVRLVVGGDTGIALYDAQWMRKDSGQLGQLSRVDSIEFNPVEGNRIAVGFAEVPHSTCSKDLPVVEIYDLTDLSSPPLKLTPDPSQISGKDEQPCWLSRVAWSKDGNTVYAGGLLWKNFARTEHASFVPLLGELDPVFDRSLCHKDEGKDSESCVSNAVLRWDLSKTSRAPAYFPVGTDIVTGLIPYRDASLIVTTADPFVSVYSDDGQLARSRSSGEILRMTGSGLNLRNPRLKITDGGVLLRACPLMMPSCFEFSILERRIDKAPFPEEPSAGEECSDLSATLKACIKGDKACPKSRLGMESHEKLQSFVVIPKSDQVVLGSSDRLRLVSCRDLADAWNREDSDAPGVRIGSDAFGVAISEKQGLVVAAHGDGVFRWYGLSSGQLVLSLFISPSLDEWLFWTPDGFFDISGGKLEDSVAWVRTTDRGGGKWGIEIFPIGDFYSKNLKPDPIDGIFFPTGPVLPETRGLAPIRDTASKSPSITIVRPESGAALPPGPLHLEYVVNNPAKVPDLSWDVSIGGVTLIETSRSQVVNEASGETRFRSILTVPERLNAPTNTDVDLRMSFANPDVMDSGIRYRRTLRWGGKPFEPPRGKPKVWGIAVGVSKYVDPEDPCVRATDPGASCQRDHPEIPDLKYAHLDAWRFTDYWCGDEGQKLWDCGPGQFITLTAPRDRGRVPGTGEATRSDIVTRSHIEDAMKDLSRKRNNSEIDASDLLVLFFAGHGGVCSFGDEKRDGLEPRYFFFPSSVDLSDINNSISGGISDFSIAEAVSWSTKPNIAIFFDTCRNVIQHKRYDANAFKAFKRIEQNFVGWMAYTANIKEATEYAYEFPIDHLRDPDADEVKSCYTRKIGVDGAGAFTWAVLRGLGGDADGAHISGRQDNKIDAHELLEYVEGRVPQEICRKQLPDATREVKSRGENLFLGERTVVPGK